MEYPVIIILFTAFIVFVILNEIMNNKKREKKFIESLYEDYGGIPHKEYSLERFARMDSYYKRHLRDGQIDDITWNDLGMDDIFKRLDYCFSASGEEYLYYKLRTLVKEPSENKHFEELVSYFMNAEHERVRLKFLTNKLGHTGKYSLYDYIENLDFLGDRKNIKHFLADLLYIPAITLMFFNFPTGILFFSVIMVYNIISYFKEKGEIEPYIVSFAYVVRLLEVSKLITAMGSLECEEEINILKSGIKKLGSLSRGAWFVFTGNKYSSSSNPIEMLMDYIKMVFHADIILFNKMLKTLRDNTSAVDDMITAVGVLEASVCVGEFRTSLKGKWCTPVFCDEKRIKIDGLYHPLLEKPVPNNIETGRGVLITGSNASGKSTFLKTVALNILLAGTINTCTADYTCTFLCRLFTSMALKDDLSRGESYYMAEIKALKRVLDVAADKNERVICFVDEVLRGTNTIERIAASAQILGSFCAPNVICFAATHDIELTYILENEYGNYHFEEEIRDDDVFFPYKIIKGRSTTQNAIKLLDIMGYDKSITNEAYSMAGRFRDTGKWI